MQFEDRPSRNRAIAMEFAKVGALAVGSFAFLCLFSMLVGYARVSPILFSPLVVTALLLALAVLLRRPTPRDGVPLSNGDANRVIEYVQSRGALETYEHLLSGEGPPTYLTVESQVRRAVAMARMSRRTELGI